MLLDAYIRTIPNYPKPGIMFKDITPLLKHADAFKASIDGLAKRLTPLNFQAIIGIESRGFIFGAALAYQMSKSFIPVRKRNKLPHDVFMMEYELEYGSDILEIHKDALNPNEPVVIIDDLLATGGTVSAVEKLVKLAGGSVQAIAFLVELSFLRGRSKLRCQNVISLLDYD